MLEYFYYFFCYMVTEIFGLKLALYVFIIFDNFK